MVSSLPGLLPGYSLVSDHISDQRYQELQGTCQPTRGHASIRMPQGRRNIPARFFISLSDIVARGFRGIRCATVIGFQMARRDNVGKRAPRILESDEVVSYPTST